MNRQTADRLLTAFVLGILLLGGYSAWQAHRRAQLTDGMMDGMMRGMPGTDPLWYVFGTLIAVSAVLGGYAVARDQFTEPASTGVPEAGSPRGTETGTHGIGGGADETVSDAASERAESTHDREPRVLSVLPEDERRIVEPILESPGLTQVELRGRSGFSKAKVSQTVSGLEDRGLVYRERQGRTYRVYPGELLKGE